MKGRRCPGPSSRTRSVSYALALALTTVLGACADTESILAVEPRFEVNEAGSVQSDRTNQPGGTQSEGATKARRRTRYAVDVD